MWNAARFVEALMMLQLVYASVASEQLDHSDLIRLCEQSERNNASVEITGVLIRHGSYFMQALEGPRVPVEDTFIRIIMDKRHTQLKLISRRLITSREFGGWGMALFEEPNSAGEMRMSASSLAASAPQFIQHAFENIVRRANQ